MRRAAGNHEKSSLGQSDRLRAFAGGRQPLSGPGAAGVLRRAAQFIRGRAVEDVEDMVAVLVPFEFLCALRLFAGQHKRKRLRLVQGPVSGILRKSLDGILNLPAIDNLELSIL